MVGWLIDWLAGYRWLMLRSKMLFELVSIEDLEGYALCRRPLLAPRGCHLGGLVSPSIFIFWGTILAPRDHPGGPWEQQDGHEVVNNRIFADFA